MEYNSRRVYNQPFSTQSLYNSRTIYDPMIMNPDQASSSSNNPSTLHPTSLHSLSPTSTTSSNNSMYLTTTINTDDDNNLSEKGIAKRVHSSLYSKRKDIQNGVIRHFYDTNAVFENPLLLVETHENIINQFILLSTFFQSIKPEVHSITDSAVTGGHHIVMIDAVIKYRFPIRLPPIPCPFFICNFLPFGWHSHHPSMFHCSNNEIALRIISRFEFNELNKIVRHEDMWSIKDLVESLPLVGWIYAEISRKVNGMITGGIVVLVSELVKEWNEWHV